jgi:hypothetical protein
MVVLDSVDRGSFIKKDTEGDPICSKGTKSLFNGGAAYNDKPIYYGYNLTNHNAKNF